MVAKPRPAPLACTISALAVLALAALARAGCGPGQPRRAGGGNGVGRQRPCQGQVPHGGTANPMATEAGLEILRAGGSAADAAVAIQLVLNLVEPQSSGLGGGAFILHWDAARAQLKGYDGRETAPAAATADRFLIDGRPRDFADAVFGGLSVGVPGTLAVLEAVHRRHGRLPWARLFAPAIRLAADGFRVSRVCICCCAGKARRASRRGAPILLRCDRQRAPGRLPASQPGARRYLAHRSPSADPKAFYKGAIAEAIVKAVREAPNHQGDLTAADLAGYSVKERDPVCIAYRGYRRVRHGPALLGRLGRGASPQAHRALRAGQGAGGGHERQGAAPDRGSREARLRRPRRLHRRP